MQKAEMTILEAFRAATWLSQQEESLFSLQTQKDTLIKKVQDVVNEELDYCAKKEAVAQLIPVLPSVAPYLSCGDVDKRRLLDIGMKMMAYGAIFAIILSEFIEKASLLVLVSGVLSVLLTLWFEWRETVDRKREYKDKVLSEARELEQLFDDGKLKYTDAPRS